MSVKRFVSVLVVLSFLFSAAPVMAEYAWYTCSINAVAVDSPADPNYTDGVYAISVTDLGGAFSDLTLWIVDSRTMKAMLSVVLTAVATDRNIRIYADTTAANPADRLQQVQLWTCDYADSCQ